MDTATGTPVITVEGLRRSYRGSFGAPPFEAVRGVDVEIRRGELFALLGTNGAGKTSLMEVLEGLARPSAGRVSVLGHDPSRERATVRPRVGILLQEAGFPSDLRVREMANVWAGTLTNPLPSAHVLGAVGLAHRAEVAVKSLSGGERRRLDLALAIMGQPEVLFLDEPTTGLDPQSRRAAWALVQNLLGAGVSVVLTTHYLEEAEALAHRIGIMHAGQIVRLGTPAQIVANEPARISFSLARDEPLPALRGRPSYSPATRTHSIATDHLQSDLRALLDWADQRQLTLGGLDARAASLEQAFLRIAQGAAQEAAINPNSTHAAQEVAA